MEVREESIVLKTTPTLNTYASLPRVVEVPGSISDPATYFSSSTDSGGQLSVTGEGMCTKYLTA